MWARSTSLKRARGSVSGHSWQESAFRGRQIEILRLVPQGRLERLCDTRRKRFVLVTSGGHPQRAFPTPASDPKTDVIDLDLSAGSSSKATADRPPILFLARIHRYRKSILCTFCVDAHFGDRKWKKSMSVAMLLASPIRLTNAPISGAETERGGDPSILFAVRINVEASRNL